jgi:hypothetical protein
MKVAGLALLLAWGGWIAASFRTEIPALVGGSPMGGTERVTQVPAWVFWGLDFQHSYASAITWLSGGDPYRHLTNDPMNGRSVYPPLTLVAFAWVKLFPAASALPLTIGWQGQQVDFTYPRNAVYLWLAVSAGIFALVARQVVRSRADLGVPRLALPLVAGLLLTSYPVMFELERGNCNVLPLLGIVGVAIFAQRPRSWAADGAIAACVAVAAGIKAYPAILILGLLALRNFRAALLALGLIGVMVAASWPSWAAWWQVIRETTGPEMQAETYLDYSHSIAMHATLLARDLHLSPAAFRTPVVAGLVLVSVTTVCWRLFRTRVSPAIAFPLLLWLAAMGTMVNKIAFDYGLIYLPCALLVLWSPGDRWWRQLLVLAVALWCQPFWLGVSGAPWLLVKCLGIVALGEMLCHRARPLGPT